MDKVKDTEADLQILADPSLCSEEIQQIYDRNDSEDIAVKVLIHANTSKQLFNKLAPVLPEEQEQSPQFEEWVNSNKFWYRVTVDLACFGSAHKVESWIYKRILKQGHYYLPAATFVNSDYAKAHFSIQQLKLWLNEIKFNYDGFEALLPNASEQEMWTLIGLKNNEALVDIAHKPDLSRDMYDQLVKSRKWEVRYALTDNPTLPIHLLRLLTRDKQADIVSKAKQALDQRQDSAVSLINSLTELTYDELIEVITTRQLTASQVDELVCSLEDSAVLFLLGLKQKPTTNLVEIILKGPEWLNASLALNPDTNQQVFKELIKLDHKDVRLSLAQNKNLSLKESMMLFESEDERLVHLLLANTTHQEVLDKVKYAPADIDNIRGTYSALLNDKTKPALISKIFHSGKFKNYADVARLVARHPACPKSKYAVFMRFFTDSFKQNASYKLSLLEHPKGITPAEYNENIFISRSKNKYMSEYECSYCFKRNNLAAHRQVASEKFANIFQLQQWVFHPDLALRKRLAARSDLTQFMVEVLSKDAKTGVRNVLVDNRKVRVKSSIVKTKDRLVGRYDSNQKRVKVDSLKPAQLIKLFDRRDREFVEGYKNHKSIIVRREIAGSGKWKVNDQILMDYCASENDSVLLHRAIYQLHRRLGKTIDEFLTIEKLNKLYAEIKTTFFQNSYNLKQQIKNYAYFFVEHVSNDAIVSDLKKLTLADLNLTERENSFFSNCGLWDKVIKNKSMDDDFLIQCMKLKPHLIFRNSTIKQMTSAKLKTILLTVIPDEYPIPIEKYIHSYSEIAVTFSADDWDQVISVTNNEPKQKSIRLVNKGAMKTKLEELKQQYFNG